jgi:uncharacterized protein YoxC
MTKEKKNYFTLDGIDYDIDSISDQAKYLVGQLNALNQDRKSLHAKLDVVETAELGFIDRLRSELISQEEEEEEEETGA